MHQSERSKKRPAPSVHLDFPYYRGKHSEHPPGPGGVGRGGSIEEGPDPPRGGPGEAFLGGVQKSRFLTPPGGVGGGTPSRGGSQWGSAPPARTPPRGGPPIRASGYPPGGGGPDPSSGGGPGPPSRGPRSGPGVAHPLGGAGRGHPTRSPPGRLVVEGPSDAEQRCGRGVVRQVRPLLNGSGKYFGAAKDPESYH